MGVSCCKPAEPTLDDTEPVPFDPDNDGLWKKASHVKSWKAGFDNGELGQYLTKQNRYDLMSGIPVDQQELGAIVVQIDAKLGDVKIKWQTRQWDEVREIERDFKILYVKAQKIHEKYYGTQPSTANPTPQAHPTQLHAAGNPVQMMQGEQNHAMQPGAGEVAPSANYPANPLPPAPTHTQQQAGVQPPIQPQAANAFAPPRAPPQPNSFQNAGHIVNTNVHHPSNVPSHAPQPMQPQIPAPVPQQPQQPMQLDPRMAKAARMMKMKIPEASVKTELRLQKIEDMFDEMVAIIKNDRPAYEAAKAARLAKASAPSAAPPPNPNRPPSMPHQANQVAAPPPRPAVNPGNPTSSTSSAAVLAANTAYNSAAAAPPKKNDIMSQIRAGGANKLKSASTGPAAPPQKPLPKKQGSLMDQIAAGRKNLNASKRTGGVRPATNSNITQVGDAVGNDKRMSTNSILFKNVSQSVDNLQTNNWMDQHQLVAGTSAWDDEPS